MTGEHLWSDWMDRAHLLRRVSREYIQIGQNIRRYTGEKTEAQRHREGSPHYSKIKAVCRCCNSGWMSKIDGDVIPILTPLIKGEKAVLSRHMRQKLVEWIALKMLVAEHSQYSGHQAAPIYSQEDRNAFREERKIPDHLRIYLAKHKSLVWGTGYHRRASGLGTEPPSFPPPPFPPAPRNVQATTWGIGRLLIYITGTTDPDVARAVRFIKDLPLRRLWPLTANDLVWPPPTVVDGTYIEDLATSLARYLDKNMVR